MCYNVHEHLSSQVPTQRFEKHFVPQPGVNLGVKTVKVKECFPCLPDGRKDAAEILVGGVPRLQHALHACVAFFLFRPHVVLDGLVDCEKVPITVHGEQSGNHRVIEEVFPPGREPQVEVIVVVRLGKKV